MTHFLAIKWAGQDNTQTLGCEIGISSDFPNCIPNPSNQIGQTRFLKSYVKVARKLLESDRKVLGTEGAVNFYSTSARLILFHNFSQNFRYNNLAPKLAYKWSETDKLIESILVLCQFLTSSMTAPGYYQVTTMA